ncbi:MAG: endonuclease/exonuclease/phosphatase family protein [Saprospiraceae bacterium]
MKNTWLTFTFLLCNMLLLAQNAPLQVMTFNIRLATKDDGYNYWGNRTDLVKSMIQYHEADIVGLQEAMKVQLDDFTKMLPDYEWFGVCRTDGSTNPNPDNEFSAILYRKDRFERLDGATFWLSDQPDKIGSKGWDAALPRIVTWAKFRDKKSGKTFFHFNTHFDHMGVKAREESAKLILTKITAIAKDAPVVLTGDFNCNETEAPYRAITNTSDQRHLQDALFISQLPHHGPLSTWSGFNFPGVPGRRIDFIFVNPDIQVLKHAILAESWSGRFPSDHLPVIARLLVK